MSGETASLQAIHCKWDFCSMTFMSFAEWETHFIVEHISYAQPMDISGRSLKKRKKIGQWELTDSEPRPTNQLPLNLSPSQTTGGDITTTSFTLSFPIPPSFHSLPDPPASIPMYNILPHCTSEHQTAASYPFPEGIQVQENDAGLYTDFLRSPSPVLGAGDLTFGSGSGSGSTHFPPLGQRRKTPPFTPSQPLSNSQPSTSSLRTSVSTPMSILRFDNSNYTPPITQPHPSLPLYTFPSQPSPIIQTTPEQAQSSSESPSRQRNDSISSQISPQGQSAKPLRFGAALGVAGSDSPRNSVKKVESRNTSVGFNWAGGGQLNSGIGQADKQTG
ncbi:uncharacterized protein L201_001556 [Kwoniella dendrophila CBS 6074]|uniref:C2H2-type domain-containing protein n=1 Tax=Kwoniella dendrophila CBS 6074 TaxID=1295534 RepID=A0AAX4JPL4_9TREE